ncbi:MAG: UDP-N-acetylmuramoyl-tripeptide--D-alanyl-D-alanine ligase, partial [Candidatus Omnitrophica bacterium]|nr:UDP-N-acetylmuramoyl-tripeptide--D-alanyl-D-alanine ligase [Candidatus Omnitrophota bacterium]
KKLFRQDWARFQNLVLVEDTLRAMGNIAARIRSKKNIPVICVTGTNGKTTVKDILSYVFAKNKNVLSSQKSFNNIIGLSLTLFGLDDGHDIAVLELGTNHPGEIGELSKIASPTAALITNIGNGHLEFFSKKENILREKVSIAEALPEKGTIFLNKDDDLLGGDIELKVQKKFFGKNRGSDFLLSGIKKNEKGYTFLVNGEDYSIALDGMHNVYNALAAISLARYFGETHNGVRERLASASLPKMRLEHVTIDNVLFVNDAYNANPDSFECALKVIEAMTFHGKKGVVAGDMNELGQEAPRLHKNLGRSIADKKMDFLIVLGKFSDDIAQGAVDAGMAKEKVRIVKDWEAAASNLREMAIGRSVVLLKASRKGKMEEVLKCFTTCCIR